MDIIPMDNILDTELLEEAQNHYVKDPT